jgi:hypothetical protein
MQVLSDIPEVRAIPVLERSDVSEVLNALDLITSHTVTTTELEPGDILISREPWGYDVSELRSVTTSSTNRNWLTVRTELEAFDCAPQHRHIIAARPSARLADFMPEEATQ